MTLCLYSQHWVDGQQESSPFSESSVKSQVDTKNAEIIISMHSSEVSSLHVSPQLKTPQSNNLDVLKAISHLTELVVGLKSTVESMDQRLYTLETALLTQNVPTPATPRFSMLNDFSFSNLLHSSPAHHLDQHVQPSPVRPRVEPPSTNLTKPQPLPTMSTQQPIDNTEPELLQQEPSQPSSQPPSQQSQQPPSRNVRGRGGKGKLNPIKMDIVKRKVFDIWPLNPSEIEKTAWAQCVCAIDEANRRLNRKK